MQGERAWIYTRLIAIERTGQSKVRMHGKPPILHVRVQHSRNIEGAPRKHRKMWRGSAMKRRDPRTKITPRHLRGKRRGEVWRGQGKVWEGAIWGSEPSQHGSHCTSHVLPGRRSDGARRWHGKGRHGEGGRGSCVCVCVCVCVCECRSHSNTHLVYITNVMMRGTAYEAEVEVFHEEAASCLACEI